MSSISTFIQGTQVSPSGILLSPWAKLVSALLSSSLVVGPGTPTPQTDMDEENIKEGDSHISSRKIFKVAFRCYRHHLNCRTQLRFGNWLEMLIKPLEYPWLLFSFEDVLMRCGLELVLFCYFCK